MAKKQFESPGHYTDKDRESIPDEDFGDASGKRYPIVTQADVHDAASLIGKAGPDKEKIKARIIAIAKRKGYSLPAAWQTDSDKERAMAPNVTRSADEMHRFVLPSSVRITDASKREFEVCATSEAVDSFGTVFSYEASKDAFQRWQARNIREMHQPIAAGKAINIQFDDTDRKIFVRGRISAGAESTWLKLQDGTLQGASIGASNVKWERKDVGGRLLPVASAYDLIELSVVDHASNPDSTGVVFLRAARLDPDEVLEMPDDTRAQLRAQQSQNATTARVDGHSPSGDQHLLPDSHDVLAADEPDADGDLLPEESLFAAVPDGTSDEVFDPKLRDVEITGAGAVAPSGASNGDVSAQLRPMSGPPANASEQTFAASVPAGDVLGSHTDGTHLAPDPGTSAPFIAPPAPVAPRAAQPSGPSGNRQGRNAERLAAMAGQAGAPAPAGTYSPDPQLAPFGMGAALPASRGGRLPTAREMRAAQRAESTNAHAEIVRAGDVAEAAFPLWNPKSGEDFNVWVQRKALARGAAEASIIARQQAESRARELANATTIVEPTGPRGTMQMRPGPAASGALPASPPVIAPPAIAQPVANQPAAPVAGQVPVAPATVAAVAAVTAGGATRADSFAPENAALVATSDQPAASAPASVPTLGTGRVSHTHTHGHERSSQRHEHDTEHTHLDGTTHAHIHAHTHDHHDHGSEALRDAGGHSHEHTHLHDHTHTYRAGAPIDTALVMAEATRTAASRAASGRKTMPVAAVATTSKPVSGSAQSAFNEQPKSPQLSVQPAAVGHLDLLNTEDANAVGFGVPAEVLPVPSPADCEITQPVGLHEGGHTASSLGAGAHLSPANSAMVDSEAAQPTNEIPHGAPDPESEGAADGDLDHDGDEDAAELAAAKAGNGESLPGLDKGARPQAANSAIVRPVASDGRAPSGAGGRAGEADEPALVAPEETRKGARISQDSRDALHAARDGQMASLKNLCEHCACDECTQHLDALAQAAQPIAPPPTVEDIERAAAVFGQQRLLAALVARGVQEQTDPLVALVARQQELLEALSARLADFELTLADTQRSQRADVSRLAQSDTARMQQIAATVSTAVSTQLQTHLNDFVPAQMTELVARLAEPMTQRLEAVAACVAGLEAGVARIEAQPMPTGAGPVAGAADKRLAIQDVLNETLAGHVPGNGNLTTRSATAANSVDATIAGLQAIARSTTDPALQSQLAATVMSLQPTTRRMLGTNNHSPNGRGGSR